MLAAQANMETDNRLSSLPALASNETTARPGERIGAYSLIREIGRGGMGSVWLAARADGSFKREVALKLPHLAWGSGLAERMHANARSARCSNTRTSRACTTPASTNAGGRSLRWS
jgi:eukaryotic-like serine/threonine-protein kinase